MWTDHTANTSISHRDKMYRGGATMQLLIIVYTDSPNAVLTWVSPKDGVHEAEIVLTQKKIIILLLIEISPFLF